MFIKTKDTKRLKYLQKQLLLMQQEARNRKEEDKSDYRDSVDKKKFLKTVNKMIEQSPKNSTHRAYRNKVFTPESALSALPSFQIAAVNPSESASQGIRRYRERAKVKSRHEIEEK